MTVETLLSAALRRRRAVWVQWVDRRMLAERRLLLRLWVATALLLAVGCCCCRPAVEGRRCRAALMMAVGRHRVVVDNRWRVRNLGGRRPNGCSRCLAAADHLVVRNYLHIGL